MCMGRVSLTKLIRYCLFSSRLCADKYSTVRRKPKTRQPSNLRFRDQGLKKHHNANSTPCKSKIFHSRIFSMSTWCDSLPSTLLPWTSRPGVWLRRGKRERSKGLYNVCVKTYRELSWKFDSLEYYTRQKFDSLECCAAGSRFTQGSNKIKCETG